MALETRSAGRSSSMNRNGMMTGMVERNTSRQMPRAPSHSSFVRPGRCREFGKLDQPLPHRFQFVARQHGNERRGQGVRQRAPAGIGIAGLPDRAQFQEVASSLAEAAHQIQPGVDDAPGQIAAERAQDHGFDLGAPCGDHAERAGAGQDHDQAEQDLGNPIDRIEPTKRKHCPDCPSLLSSAPAKTIRKSERLACAYFSELQLKVSSDSRACPIPEALERTALSCCHRPACS